MPDTATIPTTLDELDDAIDLRCELIKLGDRDLLEAELEELRGLLTARDVLRGPRCARSPG